MLTVRKAAKSSSPVASLSINLVCEDGIIRAIRGMDCIKENSPFFKLSIDPSFKFFVQVSVYELVLNGRDVN